MQESHLSYFYILKYLPIWGLVLTVLMSTFRSRLFGHFSAAKFFKQCLNQLMFWIIGIQSLGYFIAIQWYPAVVHELMHWNFPNPLLGHVTMFELSFAIIGMLSAIATIGFQTATALGYCIYVLGMGVLEIYNIFSYTGNHNPLYWLLYSHLVIPLLILILLMIVYQNKKSTS